MSEDNKDLVVMEKATYDMLRKMIYDAHLQLAQLQTKLGDTPVTTVPTRPIPVRRRPKTTELLEQCPFCGGGTPVSTEPHPTKDGVLRQRFSCGHSRNVWPAA